MTAQELFEILKKTGYPTRYSHFSKAQKPPFIAFLSNFSNNFFADNKTFKNVNHWQIELYTETKDVEAETKVEKVLSDFCWDKTEVFLNDENVFQIIYEIEDF